MIFNVVLLFILIMKDQSDHRIDSHAVQGQTMSYWDNFHLQNRNWQQDFYRKMGVDEDRIKIVLAKNAEIEKRIYKLVQEPPYRGKYIPAFNSHRKKKYYHRTIKVKSQDLQKQSECSRVNYDFMQISSVQKQSAMGYDPVKVYNWLKYQNYHLMIKTISGMKYQLNYIAKYYYIRNKNDLERSFQFQVENGQEYGSNNKKNQKQYWQVSDQLIFCILIRDIASAILQLQSFNLFHADIALHNVLLFNCQNLRDLQDPKRLQKIKTKIRFKFIDFGDVYLMSKNKNNQLSHYTDKILKLRQLIKLKQRDQFDDILQDVKILSQLKDKDRYKEIHDKKLNDIIQQVAKELISNDDRQCWKKLVKNHDYIRLVKELNDKINQQQ